MHWLLAGHLQASAMLFGPRPLFSLSFQHIYWPVLGAKEMHGGREELNV
jgi:hypothetical protein